MNSSIKIGDLVKVVFVEAWRKIGRPLPGLSEGDVGRVTAIVNGATVHMTPVGGIGAVSHAIKNVALVVEAVPKTRKAQRRRAGAYFLFHDGKPAGTCKVHGYKSKAVAMLAALEYVQGLKNDGRETVRVFLLTVHCEVYGEMWKHVCDIRA